MDDEQLPALYRSADECSRTAQSRYLQLVASDMLLLVAGGIATAIPVTCQIAGTIVAIVGGVLIVVSIVISLVLRSTRFEKTWYAGRAVAESVKTLAWKYAMKALPFESGDEESVRMLFASKLQAILAERRQLGADLATLGSEGDQVTKRMVELRGEPVAVRLNVYLDSRIIGQQRWYSSKANANNSAKSRWFIAVVASQILAATFAFILLCRKAVVV